MLLRVIDFETTGAPPDAEVCEVGWIDILIKEGEGPIWGSTTLLGLRTSGPGSLLVDPERPITPQAMAVHHIQDNQVKGQKNKEYWTKLLKGSEIGEDRVQAFVSHNSSFEEAFFPADLTRGVPWICTLKAARRVWPDAPSHALQTLRYWLPLVLDQTVGLPAHRAGPDAYVGGHLLLALIAAGAAIEDMLQWTISPSLLPRISFGKHRGLLWKELPEGYLEWVLKSDFGEDEKYTANYWLSFRSRTPG